MCVLLKWAAGLTLCLEDIISQARTPAGAWQHKGAAITLYRSTISRTFVSQRSREFGPPKQPTSIVAYANSHSSRGRVYLLTWSVEFQLIQLSSWHWSIKSPNNLWSTHRSGQGKRSALMVSVNVTVASLIWAPGLGSAPSTLRILDSRHSQALVCPYRHPENYEIHASGLPAVCHTASGAHGDFVPAAVRVSVTNTYTPDGPSLALHKSTTRALYSNLINMLDARYEKWFIPLAQYCLFCKLNCWQQLRSWW